LNVTSKRDVVAEHVGSAVLHARTTELDLFVVHAATDADFVRGYLLPALNLLDSRVLRIDELTPGAMVVSEIERGVSSRFTVVVLSAACLEDRWAMHHEPNVKRRWFAGPVRGNRAGYAPTWARAI
jgi:hypothetical protein